MKRTKRHTAICALACLLGVLTLAGCSQYTKVEKSTNAEFKYEMGKAYFIEGRYSQAISLLEDVNAFMKGSANGEECLYMLALCYYNQKDYVTAAQYLQTYYSTYPKGIYAEEARYHSARALFLDTPDPRLDQSSTVRAISEIQLFNDFFPYSKYRLSVQDMLYTLQDRLVEKEYRSAQLYYDLGNYMGNNYESCVITAKNAIKDYPYSKYKEQLEFLILKARYNEASESVEEKKEERFRTVIDEYYSFTNDYPDSQNRKEADNIFKIASKHVNDK